jgi:hypothetical protein
MSCKIITILAVLLLSTSALATDQTTLDRGSIEKSEQSFDIETLNIAQTASLFSEQTCATEIDLEIGEFAFAAVCCKVCKKGKACGDSCISRSYQCHKPKGCACDG